MGALGNGEPGTPTPIKATLGPERGKGSPSLSPIEKLTAKSVFCSALMDETFVGDKTRGKGRRYTGNKALVLGAVERGGQVRIKPARSRDGAVIGKFVAENVEDAVKFVYTDDYAAYCTAPELKDEDTYQSRSITPRTRVRGEVHTNTVESVWSLLKRSIIGSYHHVSVKHLPAYIDELDWRYNNRKNPHLFRDTLLKLCQSETLGYQELTA